MCVTCLPPVPPRSVRTSFFLSAAFGAAGCLLTAALLPDTTGLSLDELDRMVCVFVSRVCLCVCVVGMRACAPVGLQLVHARLFAGLACRSARQLVRCPSFITLAPGPSPNPPTQPLLITNAAQVHDYGALLPLPWGGRQPQAPQPLRAVSDPNGPERRPRTTASAHMHAPAFCRRRLRPPPAALPCKRGHAPPPLPARGRA